MLGAHLRLASGVGVGQPRECIPESLSEMLREEVLG